MKGCKDAEGVERGGTEEGGLKEVREFPSFKYHFRDALSVSLSHKSGARKGQKDHV